MSPYKLLDMQALVIASYGGTKKYYLCLFTTQARIFEQFFEDTGHYPLGWEVMELAEDALDIAEEFYRSNCNAVIEGG